MKYGRLERERKFLLAGVPDLPSGAEEIYIVDTYFQNTRLRLRETRTPGGEAAFKLTFKHQLSSDQHWINSFSIDAGEARLLRSRLDGAELRKTRWRWAEENDRMLCVDIFDGALRGLCVLEVEAMSDEHLQSFQPAMPVATEITSDILFSGGHLAVHGRPI
ncbi:hypothetical protein [Glycocaulis alkaliphilus]|uniref:hypothetical protein n=1 Tax=Glycocaulis alkaliphilus TaxID=1434191 RepID=UPI0014775E18|nr:hypothetical protein [Glycocaulis alkaliphilus]